MCRVAHTLASVNNEPKIQGVAESGEASPTKRMEGQRRGTRGVPILRMTIWVTTFTVIYVY